MTDNLKEGIIEYLDKCRVCTIATVDANGQPDASAVFFENSGASIYFNTGADSQKVKNIEVNPKIAVAMQETGPPPKSDREIKGIQCIGTARIFSEPEAGVPDPVVARHRAFNSATPGKSVIIEVTPQRMWLIDYSRGLRHREVLDL